MPDWEKYASDLLTVAQDKAQHRAISMKFKSKALGVVRQGSPNRGLLKPIWFTGGIVAREFLSKIPGVAAATEIGQAALEKSAGEWIKSRWRRRRIRRAQKAGDFYKVMKFQIKNLSIKKLDRYRRKAHDSMKRFFNTVDTIGKKQAYTCEDAFLVAYRYKRAVYRLEKYTSQLAWFHAVADLGEAYADQAEELLDHAGDGLDKAVAYLLEAHEGNGQSCGTNCFVFSHRKRVKLSYEAGHAKGPKAPKTPTISGNPTDPDEFEFVDLEKYARMFVDPDGDNDFIDSDSDSDSD